MKLAKLMVAIMLVTVVIAAFKSANYKRSNNALYIDTVQQPGGATACVYLVNGRKFTTTGTHQVRASQSPLLSGCPITYTVAIPN
jgi:hypothetical protein